MNDTTVSNKPSLACYLNLGTLGDRGPEHSGPDGDDAQVFAAIAKAGYEGVQGDDPAQAALAQAAGLSFAAGGRLDQAQAFADAGACCLTIHLGTGLEDDAEADRLCESVLATQQRTALPIYVETHRATVTQDMWRTVQLLRRFPELRLNADFSHWYTGLEMVYGDWQRKLDFLQPVFERVCYFHGRIGDPGCIQRAVRANDNRPFVAHFRELWTRAMAGWLRHARSGEQLIFAPELLGPSIFYAHGLTADGDLCEEGDRWQQALLLTEIAKEAFAAAVMDAG